MQKILSLTVSLTLLLALSSCGCLDFNTPEMRGGEDFSVNKIDGNKVDLNVKANIYNDNCFSVKIKPSDLELFVEGESIGTVRLNKKVKLKKRKETPIDANLTATLNDGALMKMMGYAAKGEVEVRLKGKAKGGVFIFSKKIDIDEKKKISTSGMSLGR
ncbi:LEA type 2 family protein [Crocinitomicaceae bacterium]|nr:LEA type 2 family protein [Crocinitomicaceae bacterium]MDC0257722.1 LEA type 2 family protein [Crocinitomicaceae bacterium]